VPARTAGALDATSGGRRPVPLAGLAAALATARSGSSGALRGRRLVGLALLVYMPVVVQTMLPLRLFTDCSLSGTIHDHAAASYTS
jgi:hypothetical protein